MGNTTHLSLPREPDQNTFNLFAYINNMPAAHFMINAAIYTLLSSTGNKEKFLLCGKIHKEGGSVSVQNTAWGQIKTVIKSEEPGELHSRGTMGQSWLLQVAPGTWLHHDHLVSIQETGLRF